jgi:hypothetical protein
MHVCVYACMRKCRHSWCVCACMHTRVRVCMLLFTPFKPHTVHLYMHACARGDETSRVSGGLREAYTRTCMPHTSCIMHRAPCMHASCIMHHTSCIMHASYIVHHASRFMHRASRNRQTQRCPCGVFAQAQSCMRASHTCGRVYEYVRLCIVITRAHVCDARMHDCAHAAWTSLRLHVHTRVHAYAHVCMVAYLSMGMCKRAFAYLCSQEILARSIIISAYLHMCIHAHTLTCRACMHYAYARMCAYTYLQ